MSIVFGPRKEKVIEKSQINEVKNKPKTSSVFDVITKKKEEEQETDTQNPKESGLEWTKRNLARTGSDVGEVLAGAPGDLLNLINAGFKPAYEYATGEKGKEYHEMGISKALPTSSMLQKQNPEYLQPKTTGEAGASEFVRDVTSLLIPTPGGKSKPVVKGLDWIVKQSKRLTKAMGLAGAGTAAQEGAEALGFEPDTAQKIKMGTIFIGSLGTEAGWKGAEKYKDSLYAEMRAARPAGASINATNILREAQRLKAKLQRGGKAPSSAKALEKVDELIDKINSGKGHISIEELEQFGVKTNELKSSLYDEFKADKVGRKSAKRNLNSVTGVIEEGLDEYGKSNSKYAKARADAKSAHGAIESSKKASKYMQKNLKGISAGGAGTILIEAVSNPAAIIPTIGGALASFSGLKGAELITRIVKSPVLRKYYINVLDGAARQDLSFMNKNFQYLQKKIEDDPDLLQD